jgi:hypothetical protein
MVDRQLLDNVSKISETYFFGGRHIAVSNDLVLYKLTARSDENKQRNLQSGDYRFAGIERRYFSINAVSRGGNPNRLDKNLVFYPALIKGNTRIYISNGEQTPDIVEKFVNLRVRGEHNFARKSLEAVLKKWNYENDPPVFTARTGCVIGKKHAYLGIVLNSKGRDGVDAKSASWHLDLENLEDGEFYELCVYDNEWDMTPKSSVPRPPVVLDNDVSSLRTFDQQGDVVDVVCEYLKTTHPDLRIGAFGWSRKTGDMAIINSGDLYDVLDFKKGGCSIWNKRKTIKL